MKTERRHELQTNELAVWLAVWIEKIKPYSKAIVGVIVMIATVSFAVAYVNGRNNRGRAEAWTAYFNAFETGDTGAYEEVSKSFPGTSAALWALQSAGDAALAAGSGQLFRDRDAANGELEKARDAYQQVVQEVDAAGLSEEAKQMLKQRALFGLGQALESLGEFTEAQQQYQTIVGEYPAAVASSLAQQRLDSLNKQSIQEWYAWFAEQKPAASPITTPGLFDRLPNLPDNPDINLPRPGELLTPRGDTTSSGDGVLDALNTDTTSGEESGLPLFGPDNSTDDGTPKLFDTPAQSTDDAATDDAATDGDSIGELPGADEDPGGTVSDDLNLDEEPSEATEDEATEDEATEDEATEDEATGGTGDGP